MTKNIETVEELIAAVDAAWAENVANKPLGSALTEVGDLFAKKVGAHDPDFVTLMAMIAGLTAIHISILRNTAQDIGASPEQLALVVPAAMELVRRGFAKSMCN